LNKKREVRKFVKEQCGANVRDEKRKYVSQPCEEYPELFIKYVGGKPPVITFADDGESVDISNFKNDEIHELMQSKGFERIEKPKEEEKEPETESATDKAEATVESAAPPPKKPEMSAEEKLNMLEKMKNFKLPGLDKIKDMVKKGKLKKDTAKEKEEEEASAGDETAKAEAAKPEL